MEIYIVEALRWGKRENHSYTVGVYSKKAAAIKHADKHTEYRGGKYACVVWEMDLMDKFNGDGDCNEDKEIYRTKSVINEENEFTIPKRLLNPKP